MENVSEYGYYSLGLAQHYISTLFKEDVSESDVMDVAQILLPLIGNTHQLIYVYENRPVKFKDFFLLEVPCNIGIIEGITVATDVQSAIGDKLVIIDKEVRVFKDLPRYYLGGTFINYLVTEEGIKVDPQFENQTLRVMYRGDIVDEDGNPKVTDKEAIAIAYYYMYMREEARTFKGTGGQNIQFAYQRAMQKVQQARVPNKLTQNTMNNVKRIIKTRNVTKRYQSTRFGL